MGAITFDTHKFMPKLEEAGFEPKQAEAVADAFREAQGEAELATNGTSNGSRPSWTLASSPRTASCASTAGCSG